MYAVTRAPSEARKVKVAIYRGTGRERIVVFGAEPVRFGELPPEIEDELTSEKPRLVATEIPHERKKLPPEPAKPAATGAQNEGTAGSTTDDGDL